VLANTMGMLRTFLIDGGGRAPRWLKFLWVALTRPLVAGRLLDLRDWSKRMVVALVMQSRDNSVTVASRRSVWGWGLRSEAGRGTWLDLFNIPTTAHFIGGCAIGDSPERGVADHQRPGRAGRLDVAQPRRGRPAPGALRGLPTPSP
jgi:cholesterol oxidase